MNNPIKNDNLLNKTKRFTLKGEVTNNTLDKTITVLVTNNFRHSIYQKTVSSNKKYLVHDPKNQCQIGDYVLITSVRKISKRKVFRLVKVITPSQERVNVQSNLSNSK